ncbi:unnamed protein product [Camellia sinensis]
MDSDRRLATKSDDSSSTRLVWNAHFALPLSLPFHDSLLTLKIFYSKPSETRNPLVGSLCLALKELAGRDDDSKEELRLKITMPR